MACVVMKFGGACFADGQRTQQVAARVAESGAEVVVVVSARLGVTDALLRDMCAAGDGEGSVVRDVMLATGELQSAAVLATALIALGRKAAVVPPWLIFRTDSVFGDAAIRRVDIGPVQHYLDDGVIPVVPGFVGADDVGRITTLGRGGTDYSAVALGRALGACVELFKAEVDGVYDADPHERADARRFPSLTHAEALTLSRGGAKVLQEKAAALALSGRVRVRVRPAFHDGPGTDIHDATEPLTCTAS